MDVFKLLEKDHKTVQDILTQLSETSDRAIKSRQSLYEKFKKEFTLHSKFEEIELYPRLKEKSETRSLTLEAYQEHHVADVLIKEIDDLPYDDENWKPKITVLTENIKHHVKEEEKEMFPQAKKSLEAEEIKELTEKFLESKG